MFPGTCCFRRLAPPVSFRRPFTGGPPVTGQFGKSFRTLWHRGKGNSKSILSIVSLHVTFIYSKIRFKRWALVDFCVSFYKLLKCTMYKTIEISEEGMKMSIRFYLKMNKHLCWNIGTNFFCILFTICIYALWRVIFAPCFLPFYTSSLL